MKKGIQYPLADEIGRHLPGTVAVSTGDYRKPKKGEWYISGAIPEGYRAPRDLPGNHWIAVLQRSEREALKERLRTGKIVKIEVTSDVVAGEMIRHLESERDELLTVLKVFRDEMRDGIQAPSRGLVDAVRFVIKKVEGKSK